MFTGIVQAAGTITARTGRGGDLELTIESPQLDAARARPGDSVSVNGVCLTVTRWMGGALSADVSRETLAVTTLGSLPAGSRVNLEPALRAGDVLGGHLVAGHVDGLATLVSSDADARSQRMMFELPPALQRFVASKGSICLDGVSLTVNEVSGNRFAVNVVPHTREVTTLGELRPGDRVNVEVDVIARYLDRLVGAGEHAGNLMNPQAR